MGIGFKKGHRESPKKTAKALENDTAQLEGRVRNAMMMLQMQLQQLNARVAPLEQQAELMDFRSLATLKLLVSKGAFTNEEHDAMAELTRIESFNEQSDRDSATRFLKPVPAETTLDKGLVYIARIDASEPKSLTVPATEAGGADFFEPNPNAGKKIDQLSMLRMKVVFGSGEFPSTFEENFKTAKAGDTVSFTIECPKELGPYAGKLADFKVNVLQIFKADPPAATPSESVAASFPALVEEPT